MLPALIVEKGVTVGVSVGVSDDTGGRGSMCLELALR